MKQIAVVVFLLFGIASVACTEQGGESSSEPVSETKNEASPAPDETPEPSPEPDPSPKLAALDESIVIPGTANIFGAGRKLPPDPGGGGAGTLPPGWRLPGGSARVVKFPSATGAVNPWVTYDITNGPDGDKTHSTDVESFRGISGIVHRRNGSFLVGVFLTNAPPTNPAPPRLNVTKPSPTDLIAPQIGQVFFIGDGKDYRYTVPPEATRLFLGTADARLWRGPPGYYGNNSGEFMATIALTKG